MKQQSSTIASPTTSEGENVSEIQSLTLRIRDLNQAADWWNTAMIWALVLAAISAVAVVVTTRIALIRARQLGSAQSELSQAKDRELAHELKRKDEAIQGVKTTGDLEAKRIESEAGIKIAELEVEALTLRKELAFQAPRANLLVGNKRRALVDATKTVCQPNNRCSP